MHLQSANLCFGVHERQYDVKADDHPDLPLVFDFAHPEQCAVQVLAVMSLASGGYALHNCRVNVHVGRHTASITASGVAVHYAPRSAAQPITAEQAQSVFEQTVKYQLGTVGPRGKVKYAIEGIDAAYDKLVRGRKARGTIPR